VNKKAIWISSEAFNDVKNISKEWGTTLGDTIEYIIEEYESMKESN